MKAKPSIKKIDVIPSNTPPDLKFKGDLVMETIGKVKKEDKAKTQKKGKKVKSYKPSIYEWSKSVIQSIYGEAKPFRPSIYGKLDTINSLDQSDEEIMKNYNGANWPYGAICTIKDGTKKDLKKKWYGMRFHENKDGRLNPINEEVDCSLFGEKWINYYLTGLKQTMRDMKKQSFVDNIVAPKQYQANCWFNTFFVAFFISDKGRSFFEYFRRLMIQGKAVHNKEKMSSKGARHLKDIPPRLHNALFRFNVMIHDALIGRLGNSDTNEIIDAIYFAVPQRKRQGIKKRGLLNNPIGFYLSLMTYLDDDYVHMVWAPVRRDHDGSQRYWFDAASRVVDLGVKTYKPKNLARKDYDGERSLSKMAKAPDIIMFEVNDDISKNVKQVPNEISVTRWGNHPAKESLEAVIPPGGKITYKLDAAIVRNTKKHHSCCCLTINGKDYAFDGVSHRRLQKYNWRKNLGKDQEWTFEGSEELQWNFRQGHYMLLYYRTK